MADPTTTRSGAVRLRLDLTDVRAQQLLSAAGARHSAYNWALARIVANHAQWKAEESYDIVKADRTRPFSFFDLVKQWDAAKREQTPWFGEHSTWTFRYAIRAAARAHADFLSGKTKFPRFKSGHRDRRRFTFTDGRRLEVGRVRVAKYGWLRIAAPCAAQAKLRRLLVRGRARLDSSRAAGAAFVVNLVTPDNGQTFVVELRNSTLTSLQGFLSSAPDLTLTLNRTDLEKAMIGVAPLQQQVAEGTAVVEGDPSVLTALAGMLTEFDATFAIMPGTIPGGAPVPSDAFQYRDLGDSSGG